MSKKTSLKKEQPTKTTFPKKTVLILAVCLLVIIALVLSIGKQNEIIFDFNDVNEINKWKFYNNAKIDKKTQGISISRTGNNPAIMFNDDDALSYYSWQQFPYLKINTSIKFKDTRLVLLWAPNKNINQSIHKEIIIPALNTETIVDLHQAIPWKRSMPWNDSMGNSTINSFGLLINDNIELNSISLASSVGVIDYISLFINHLAQVEPIVTSSINFTYGITIMGYKLNYLLGLMLIPLFLIFALVKNKRILVSAVFATGLLFFVADIPHFNSFFGAVSEAGTKSAWHSNKHQEYKSRFGEAFAKLAQAFEQKVAKGNKVHFPKTKHFVVMGETNWIEFQYLGVYQPKKLSEADYVLYYYPRNISLENDKTLISGNSKYKVEPIIKLNPQMQILKVIAPINNKDK